MKGVAMWTTRSIDPRFFIHSRSLHDECIIVLPFADRVPEPPRFGILWELSPICPNHPPDLAVLVEHYDLLGLLENLGCSEFKKLFSWKSLRVTMPCGIIRIRRKNRPG